MITNIRHKRNVIVSQWLLGWGEVRKNVWFVKIDKLKIQSNVFRQLKFSEVILNCSIVSPFISTETKVFVASFLTDSKV